MDYKKELNKMIKKLKEFQLALNESSAVSITDQHGVIQFVNDRFCQLSKYSKQELVGNKQKILNSGYHSDDFFKNLWETVSNGNVWRGEMKDRAKDGSYFWLDTTIVPFLDEDGEPYQYISIRHDITKRKQYEETIEKMAYYDPLTSLPNRNLLNKWLMEQFNAKDSYITVLFLDLDRFKSINDNHGHRIGDFILKETARRLKNCLRKSDFITRQGGDEFIILLNGIYEKNDIITVANKIIQQLTLPFHVNNKRILTSTSIGISIKTVQGSLEETGQQCIEKLIKQADIALYHAKKQGGSTYCFNTPDQNIELERYYQIEQEINGAMKNNQFSIAYQPLVDLQNEDIIGVEALLRWNNPNLGNVPPNEFIPILEELGLIIPVGRWVFESVCKQIKEWHEEEIKIQRASVNVSPIQFRDRDFVRDIKNILQETKVDPELLEIEITEGTILNIDKSLNVLNELKQIGVRISIDDFGTGYSSLSYLKKLSINTLKIDKSFIQDLDDDGEVIVNTIINMGKNLQFNVLAEGIENMQQLIYLKQQECHEGQGFYWSKPVPPNEISNIYEKIKQQKERV